MKTRFLILILITAALALTFAGCSSNKPIAPKQDGIPLKMGPTTTYPNLSVPAWILYPEKGLKAIGVAQDSPAAKTDFAASAEYNAKLTLALAKPVFKFDTEAYLKAIAFPADSLVLDKITLTPVSPDKETISALPELKLKAETILSGYRFVLLSQDEVAINYDPVTISAALLPSWCRKLDAYPENEFYYAVGVAEDADLVTAWQKARDKAAEKLAYARLRKAAEEIAGSQDMDEKLRLADSALLNLDMSFTKNYFYYKTVDGKGSYVAFRQLQMNN